MGNYYDAGGNLPLHIIHGQKGDMHYYNLAGVEAIHLQTMMLYRELVNDDRVRGDPIVFEDISIIVLMKNNMANCTNSINYEI
jgi:hypothetical protein